MTRYAERVEGDNAWTGGENIIPLSQAEAREWVERHCDADTYERLFGPVEE